MTGLSAPDASPLPEAAPRRARVAWCLYDWANSAFPTVIVTFVFSTYFVSAIQTDTAVGTAQWSQALVLSGLAIAFCSPIFGAIADRTGTAVCHRYGEFYRSVESIASGGV